jgi:molybdenum cofactor cytidylyltransferase
MYLPEAIDLKQGDILAFVGAGGKTSAMFALADAIESQTVLTTTTHLGAWQAGLADGHRICNFPDEINALDFQVYKKLLITGPAGADERLAGLSENVLNVLHVRCKNLTLPLLIEADGARQRSLKAPAAYEPAIPGWVTCVVVMAGLAGLGQPLVEARVHRPKIFSALSGCGIGAIIDIDHLAAVLLSQEGGLKAIPRGTRRICFLNQSEGERLQGLGAQLAGRLITAYDRVLVGSLHEPRQDGPIFSVHAKTAGVILAAGGSERLGRPKQLLDWQGRPFVRQVALNTLEAGLDPLVAVTGADQTQVENALAGLPVMCVQNPNWRAGQSTSMQAGLSALPQNTDSVLFLLSDQPQIGPALIGPLLTRYAARRRPITAPKVYGRRGNPVLFSREAFDALQRVEGDRGGRAVFGQFEVDWLPWDDDRIFLDVDEVGDYERLLDAYSLD